MSMELAEMVRERTRGYVETVQGYHTAAKKALAMLAITATAAGGAGCGLAGGGGSRPIGGEYLYTSPDGATVESLNLVRDGSHLTGNVETLFPVTSGRAQSVFDILDAYGRPVPGTPVNAPVYDPKTGEETAATDNAACGGTPICFQDVTGTVDGRLGANNKISLSIVSADLSPTPSTSVGELQGDGFVLDGAKFMPSDSKDIAAARSRAPKFLRTVTMPAYEVHQEISALEKPTIYLFTDTPWDGLLAQDVSTLQSDANINPVNQLGCSYSEIISRDIRSMQDDVTAEGAEITKTEKLLDSLTPAARRQAGGDIATVQGEIKARKNDLLQEVKQANTVIAQASAEAPKVETPLQRTECGAIDLAGHVILEAGD